MSADVLAKPILMNKAARFIALYLPQFHPIPENDEWWGKGFTEWTNTGKARSLFRGHYQPHVPADLGYYDLRLPEARIAQADLARAYGIEAFCYYYYWSDGKRLLERPFNEVLASGEPQFPFCLCWANQTWSGVWHGSPNRILMQQTYPGRADYRAQFRMLEEAFSDTRYVTIEGKPLLLLFHPTHIPDIRMVSDYLRSLAVEAGFKGLYLVGFQETPPWLPQDIGLDASVTPRLPPIRRENWISWRTPLKRIARTFQNALGRPTIYAYSSLASQFVDDKSSRLDDYPCLIPNWDNTPRSGANGLVLHGSTPELFRIQVKKALRIMQAVPPETRLIFIKSWNEWAEGNHLEPDLKFGHGYLKVLKEEREAIERLSLVRDLEMAGQV
jgi:lipopolysaccharide biosynthesis protein